MDDVTDTIKVALGCVQQAMDYLFSNSPVLAFRELQEADLLLTRITNAYTETKSGKKVGDRITTKQWGENLQGDSQICGCVGWHDRKDQIWPNSDHM